MSAFPHPSRVAGEDAVLDGEQRGRGSGGDADLGVDVLEVVIGGEVPRFFKEIGSNVEVTEFTLVSLASNETDVVATVHWTYRVNRTGRTAEMYMQHWWRFADGAIVWFRGSEDTEQSAAAFA